MSFSFLDKLSSTTDGEEKDEFDLIKCPNTFDDDSHVDQFFDTHKSTPSPRLRRSQRLKKKQSGSNETVPQTTKKVVELKTPPKKSAGSGSSYASCASSTPYSTPPADMKKATTTPGPPPRSLLKLAIGNSIRNKPMPDVTIVVAPKRLGPQTSTPKPGTKSAIRSQNVKENQVPPIAEEPPKLKKASLKKTATVAKPKTIKNPEVTRSVKRIVTNSAARLPPVRTVKVVARRSDLAAGRAMSAKATSAKPMATCVEQEAPKNKKSIAQKLNPQRFEPRKSLKTIVKKRRSDGKKAEGIKNRVAAARKAANENRGKPQKATGGQYSHVKSKIAEMINSGPASTGPNLRDMKTRDAEVKTARKPLHDKPFIPAGKIKYSAKVEVVPGDMTVNGQTMAQFVKNFQCQTPPRYRSLKPTDHFKNTCVNHTVQAPNPTIPQSPRFATKDRLKNASKPKQS